RRRSKGALGARCPLDPAIGFLLFNRLAAVVGGRRLLARPNLHSSQPEQGSAARINRQHRMHEQPRVTPIAGWPKPPYAPGVLGVVQFRGVLDRKHMQARDPLRQRFCAMHGNFLGCHARIVQPAAEPYPFGPAIGRRSQVHRDAFNGALQQQRPLLASRASPKRPTDQSSSSIIAVIPLVDRTERNQTRFHLGNKNCVHALAHRERCAASSGRDICRLKNSSLKAKADTNSPPRLTCPMGRRSPTRCSRIASPAARMYWPPSASRSRSRPRASPRSASISPGLVRARAISPIRPSPPTSPISSAPPLICARQGKRPRS